MYGKVNPSGCVERHELMQVRLDLCLDTGDTRYNDARFYQIDPTSKAYLRGYKGATVTDPLTGEKVPADWEAYAAWEASLPRVWDAERVFHHHMIYFDPYTLRDEQITDAINLHLPNFYRAWIAEWDRFQGGMRHGWDTTTRKRPTRFPELYAARKAECDAKLAILKASAFVTSVSRVGETFPSTSIDIGPAASNRAVSQGYGSTRINLDNAANDTGSLDSIDIWAANSMNNGCTAATFYLDSGTTYITRDSQSLGNIASGAARSITGLDISVVAGDFIGSYFPTSGSIEYDSSGFAGVMTVAGDYTAPSSSISYALYSGDATSLYGTGETGAAPTTYTSTPTIDALLRATDTETVSVDALLRGLASCGVQIDAILHGAGRETVIIDALLRALDTKAVTIDALLKTIESQGVDIDAILRATDSETVDIDALLRAVDWETVSIDALLKALDSLSVELDGVIVDRLVSALDIDALLKAVDSQEIDIDALLKGTESSLSQVDVILQEPAAPRGILTIDAVGLLAQLQYEALIDYTASEKGIDVIVGEILALQVNPNPLTVGTIDYTENRSITVEKDTMLGALHRLQESVGGYMYVDSSKAFQWRTSQGSDVGQQLRFGKNLMSVRRQRDFTELANRLYCYGAGEGESLIRLGKKTVTVSPVDSDDTAGKGYVSGAWSFSKSSLSAYTGRRTSSTSLRGYGGGIRFPGIAIAQGLTIVKAELRLTAYGAQSGSNVLSKMWAQDVDNAAAFTDVTDYDTRLAQKTTALYTDTSIPSWTTGQQYTFDVTTAVQEIIDRVGWVTGNAIALFWEDHDMRTTDQSYRQWHTTGTKAPVLYIEATDPGMADYIEDAASKELYGYASGQPLVDKSITESDTLFEWAIRQLGERAYPVVSYQGAMADLERYGFPFDATELGSLVRIMDEAIELDAWTNIIRLRRNLVDRMDVQVELSNRAPTVLDKLQFAKDPRWRQHFY